VPVFTVQAERKHRAFLTTIVLEYDDLFSQTIFGMFYLNDDALWRWRQEFALCEVRFPTASEV
jgi:hypothetical protein